MPEFIMKTDGAVDGLLDPVSDGSSDGTTVTWNDLDDVTRGYIEAMFFTSECPQVDEEEFRTPELQSAIEEGTQDGVLPCDAEFGDISADSLQSILDDCAAFQREAATILADLPSDYDLEQAGRDLWFTRNRHGVGFWDREELESSIGQRLTKIAQSFGEVNPWFNLETGKVEVE